MINSIITICGHLVDRILCDERGNSITLPPFYPGEYQFKLKLVDIGADGEPHVIYPLVTSLTASIGLVYAEPRAGSFRLRYHPTAGPPGDPTDSILFNEDSEDFRNKLLALPESGTAAHNLAEVYQPTRSTWVCRFDTTLVPVHLEPAPGNDLEPETFVRVREFEQSGQNWAEVRLIQGPVASTSAYEPILPVGPSVDRIRSGFTQVLEGGLEVIVVNEIQAIYVPPGFAGTYIITFQGRQTAPFSPTDGVSVIQSGLNRLYSDPKPINRFVVTNPESNRAYVEFIGPLGGAPMPLMEATVSSEGKTDQLFKLNLNTAEVGEALRLNEKAEMTLEVILHIQDPNNDDDPGQDLTLFQAPVTIVRPLHWDGLIEAAPIDWLLPPNPTDYVPFDRNQVTTGNQTYRRSFGDGEADTFTFDHRLGSDVLNIEVRVNSSPGRRLHDDEYEVEFLNPDALTITFPSIPEDNSLVLFIIGPSTSQFRDHGHDIGQIGGLQAQLNSIMIRLSALEAYIPVVPISPPEGTDPFGPQGATPSDMIIGVSIPSIWKIVPTNRPSGDKQPTADEKTLPTAGYMLPAVHDSIELGTFTATPADNKIHLDDPTEQLVAGQRVRIYPATFYEIGTCSFSNQTNKVTTLWPTTLPVGFEAGRKVKFTGGILPNSIAPSFIYYVIDPVTSNTFQISSTKGGSFLPLSGTSTSTALHPHLYWTVAEPPEGLEEAVDYFVNAPTGSPTSSFKLASTLAGATTAVSTIDITSEGYPPMGMSAIEDAPDVVALTNRLPPPLPYAGRAFSMRDTVQLSGGRGIRAVTVYPEDIVASDGRLWYPVTRSDSPGSNSFYPVRMEVEIFRLAINDRMLPAQSTFTLTWDLMLRMYKHTTNSQYLMVCEWADLPSLSEPSPLGPNLFAVIWNKVPIVSQKLIATEIGILHHFGVQVVRLPTGVLKTNKKIYDVKAAGDSIPNSANFALRCRMIEFDTEDNVKDAIGLVYFSMEKPIGKITRVSPLAAPEDIL